MARNIRYGAAGIHFPPLEGHLGAVQGYERAGFDFTIWADQTSLTIPRSIWTPDLVPCSEHWDIDLYMDPWLLASTAATATERMELGITVIDSLRRLPANIAQLSLSMDHISKGRFFFAMGAGELKQFAPYGVPRRKPFGHLEESMKIVRMLWESEDPVNYDGPIWKLENATMPLMPYGDSPPKLLVAGGPGRSVDIAGKYGDGWCTYIPTCGDPEWYAAQVKSVKEAAEKNGRDPDELIFWLLCMCIIDETEDKVEEWTHHPVIRWDAAAVIPTGDTFPSWGYKNPLGDDWSYPAMLLPMNYSREQALAIADEVDPGAVRFARACGTPEQVANIIQPYIEAGGNAVNIINYNTLLSSADFGDAEKKQSLVGDTIAHLRRLNGQAPAAP